MTGRPWNGRRIALIGVLAVLAAALVVPNVSAQLGRPGGGLGPVAPPAPPGGGLGGMPGGPPGFPPGGPGPGMMPQPNMPGGLGGNVPQMPRPDMPGGPQMPRPNMPGGPIGPPGGFGGPLFETVWKCGKCQKEIGTGAFPPATCPHCGVHLINGMGNGDKPARDNPGGFNALRGPQPGPQPGPVDPPPAFDGGMPGPQAGPLGGAVDPDPFGQNGGNWRPDHLRELDHEQDKSDRAKREAEASRRRTFWIVLGIVGGVGTLLIVAMVVFGILAQSGNNKKRAARRPKRKPVSSRRYEDDDEDDYIPRKRSRRYYD